MCLLAQINLIGYLSFSNLSLGQELKTEKNKVTNASTWNACQIAIKRKFGLLQIEENVDHGW